MAKRCTFDVQLGLELEVVINKPLDKNVVQRAVQIAFGHVGGMNIAEWLMLLFHAMGRDDLVPQSGSIRLVEIGQADLKRVEET